MSQHNEVQHSKAEAHIRAIAFYLPQYHPVPENNEWWGKGFTEWTNVTKARPLFRGHYQPHLPADLGFYDLRLPEARQAQADLAEQYGIHGFCYYHYWFNGRRLLERPFNDVLSSGEPNFPFCLCWANETWSRRWLGEEQEVLIKQTHSEEDDVEHARWLCKAFQDPRYIRVDGRPLFLVYRPKHLPDPAHFKEALRQECQNQGIADPYLLGVDAHCPGTDCRELGFDNTLRFEPQLSVLHGANYDGWSKGRFVRNLKLRVLSGKAKVFDYDEACQSMNTYMMDPNRKFPTIPSVFVSWDNTPRRGDKGTIIINSSPDKFGWRLKAAARLSETATEKTGLVFINAWNEWAEGNHLEPDQKYGTRYLEQVKSVIEETETVKK